MSVLEKVRSWIDGDSAELVLEEAARDAQVKPRSKSEGFIVKIARAVEEVMQEEMVPLPQGTTIIPTEYVVFLSNEDDKDWQGVKRKGLEQGLYHILAERAREIAGQKKLETKSFVIELRVDGTLSEGDVRVQHSWDDDSSNKTSVLSRPKGFEKLKQANQDPPAQQNLPTPNFTGGQTLIPAQKNPNPPIAPDFSQLEQPQFTKMQNADIEEVTHVHSKQKELYRLEVWHSGTRQNVFPIYQTEIKIGRGSRSKPVDIVLSGDPEISRLHAKLLFNQTHGTFAFINEGRNPAIFNNSELPISQPVQITPGIPIYICSYLIRIQPM